MISYSALGFAAFVIPSIKPFVIQRYPLLDNLFDIWGVISCFLLILSLCLRSKRVVVPRIVRLIICFFCVLLISTCVHFPEEAVPLCSELARLFITPFYLMLKFSKGRQAYSRAELMLRKYYILVLCIDIILSFLGFAGYGISNQIEYSYLGLDNYAAFTVLPMLMIVMYISYKHKGYVRRVDIFLFWLCLLAKLITFSFTAAIALAVAGLIYSFKVKQRAFGGVPRFLMLCIILFVISVIYFRTDQILDTFLSTIGKGIGSRQMIWSRTVNSIPKSIVIGYGKTTGDQFKSTVGLSLVWDTQATHPHNFFLSVLFSTGMIGFALYCGMLNELFNFIQKSMNTQGRRIILACTVSYLVLGLMDDYIILPVFYTFLVMLGLERCALEKQR